MGRKHGPAPRRTGLQFSRSVFEEVVSDALDRLPDEFAELMSNIAIQIEDWPDDDTLRELDLDPPDRHPLRSLHRHSVG